MSKENQISYVTLQNDSVSNKTNRNRRVFDQLTAAELSAFYNGTFKYWNILTKGSHYDQSVVNNRQVVWNYILEDVNSKGLGNRTIDDLKRRWKKVPKTDEGKTKVKKSVSKAVLDDDIIDDMPLQTRIAIPSTTSASSVKKKITIVNPGPSHTLKSQPLSPTKLKVTRQMTANLTESKNQPSDNLKIAGHEEVCLKWNSHYNNMQSTLPNLLNGEKYVDVTLAAEGKTLKCHRVILSSCSTYFEEIFNGMSPYQHPVIFMKDIPFSILKCLCDFMYAGEVHINQNNLEELLAVAEALKIKGLAKKENTNTETISTEVAKKTETPVIQDPKYQLRDVRKITQQNDTPPAKKTQTTTNTTSSKKIIGNIGNVKIFRKEGKQPDKLEKKISDPLDLLQPIYVETVNPENYPNLVQNKDKSFNWKKTLQRKVKKRKVEEEEVAEVPVEPSVPFLSGRKGTRSRPNVKIPKYYHTDFVETDEIANNKGETSADFEKTFEIVPNPSSQNITNEEPLLEFDEIKTEPIDVEENILDFRESDIIFDEDEEEIIADSYENCPILPIKVPDSQKKQEPLPILIENVISCQNDAENSNSPSDLGLNTEETSKNIENDVKTATVSKINEPESEKHQNPDCVCEITNENMEQDIINEMNDSINQNPDSDQNPDLCQNPDLNNSNPDLNDQNPDLICNNPDLIKQNSKPHEMPDLEMQNPNLNNPDLTSQNPDLTSNDPDSISQNPDPSDQDLAQISQETSNIEKSPDSNSKNADLGIQNADLASQNPDLSSENTDLDVENDGDIEMTLETSNFENESHSEVKEIEKTAFSENEVTNLNESTPKSVNLVQYEHNYPEKPLENSVATNISEQIDNLETIDNVLQTNVLSEDISEILVSQTDAN